MKISPGEIAWVVIGLVVVVGGVISNRRDDRS